MALRDIIVIPDPRLKLVSEPVATVNSEVRKLADDMLETMYEAPGIGLAAIQIAVAKRIVTIDLARKDEPKKPLVLINPEITWTSEEHSVYEEGCLSIPDLRGVVPRWKRVRLEALDRHAQPYTVEAEGFYARVIQHECDHLEGGVYLDRMDGLRSLSFLREFERFVVSREDE